MPIYEYRCENCGHEMEAIQKVSEDPLRRCPDCATDGLVKRVSAAGFRLKGGGWYETDFKSGNKRNVSGDKSGADAPASGTADSGGAPDKKPASGASSGSDNSASKASTGSSKSD